MNHLRPQNLNWISQVPVWQKEKADTVPEPRIVVVQPNIKLKLTPTAPMKGPVTMDCGAFQKTNRVGRRRWVICPDWAPQGETLLRMELPRQGENAIRQRAGNPARRLATNRSASRDCQRFTRISFKDENTN